LQYVSHGTNSQSAVCHILPRDDLLQQTYFLGHLDHHPSNV